jgi:hypothetical protein
MADRSFHRHLGSLEIDVVTLYANVSIGATGAPTLNTSPGSKGITSVTRNSAGDYTFQFDDKYQKLLWADVIVLDATLSNPSTVGMVGTIKAVNEPNTNGMTVEVVFYEMANAATAVDPRNGAKVLACFHVRNSSTT